jgi:hypothetical protein
MVRVQTGSVVHTHSYTMDTGVFFFGDKAAAAIHSPSSSAEVKNSRSYIYTSKQVIDKHKNNFSSVSLCNFVYPLLLIVS